MLTVTVVISSASLPVSNSCSTKDRSKYHLLECTISNDPFQGKQRAWLSTDAHHNLWASNSRTIGVLDSRPDLSLKLGGASKQCRTHFDISIKHRRQLSLALLQLVGNGVASQGPRVCELSCATQRGQQLPFANARRDRGKQSVKHIIPGATNWVNVIIITEFSTKR